MVRTQGAAIIPPTRRRRRGEATVLVCVDWSSPRASEWRCGSCKSECAGADRRRSQPRRVDGIERPPAPASGARNSSKAVAPMTLHPQTGEGGHPHRKVVCHAGRKAPVK